MPRRLPLKRYAWTAFLALGGCAVTDLDLGLNRPPLTIGEPIDRATRSRLARAVGGDPAACQAWLTAASVSFTPLADRTESADCQVAGAVALGDAAAGSDVKLSPSKPMMTCPLAAAVAVWKVQSVRPAARAMLGSPVTGVDHYGVYACRRVNNAEAGRYSAHARAAAIDIAGFRLADGRRISVERDWNGGDAAKAAFLRRVRDDACATFGVTLSPDYNAAHANHLHLESGRGRLCG